MNHDEQSLLDEIEELQVLEAEELQEGVAFHAFRFHMPNPMESLILELRDKAELLADKLKLPRGAVLLDVVGDKMRVMFDPKEVELDEVKKYVTKSLGDKVGRVDHDAKAQLELTQVRR